MRKSSIKNDRPDRNKSLALSPVMSALAKVFKSRKSSVKADAVSDAPPQSATVRFEALEPRVLLSGDVNPAALTVSGELTAPGEQQVHTLDLTQPAVVLLDSLTPRTDINWTLSGPDGQVASSNFAETDTQYATQHLSLAAGHYEFSVSGAGDAVGAYSLRVVDAAAAAPLNLQDANQATLAHGSDLAVYSFSAQAGSKYAYFPLSVTNDSGAPEYGPISWTLIDPEGMPDEIGRAHV